MKISTETVQFIGEHGLRLLQAGLIIFGGLFMLNLAISGGSGMVGAFFGTLFTAGFILDMILLGVLWVLTR